MDMRVCKVNQYLHFSPQRSTSQQIYSSPQKNFNKTQNFCYCENFKPILQGKLLKKTQNLIWQSRYFCLSSTRIIYFANSNKKQVKGCFNLASLVKNKIFLLKDLNRPILRLIVLASKNNLSEICQKQLLAISYQQNPQKLETWKLHISKILKNLYQQNTNLYHQITNKSILSPTIKIYQQNFWNQIFITGQELLSYGSHLDIVFFKSKDVVTNMQRVLMGSDFDHVAILLRDSKNELLVLEAIESRGVWVNEWKQMLPTFMSCYQKIGYRKLIFQDKQKIDVCVLEQYVESIIGNDYQLSLSKLLINEDDTTAEQNQSEFKGSFLLEKNKIRKNKTFFCSELIADIYIKFGLIKGRKRNQFWPKDFQSNLKLQMAQLSPLMYLCI